MKIILGKCSFNECSELALICKWVLLYNAFKIWLNIERTDHSLTILKKMLKDDKFNSITFLRISIESSKIPYWHIV